MNSCSIESTDSEPESAPKYCRMSASTSSREAGDEPDRPGEDERDLVRQGDIVVRDGGELQGLALLADGKNQILSRKTLGDQAADRVRDLFAPPVRALPCPAHRRLGCELMPMSPARYESRFSQSTRCF